MYKNLKIQERLKKCFTVVTLLASIAGVIWSNYDAYYIYAV